MNVFFATTVSQQQKTNNKIFDAKPQRNEY